MRQDLSRREMVGILGAAGASALAGCRPAEAGEGAGTLLHRSATLLDPLDCVVTPSQTEGPYFVDERLNRADIRLDPVTNLVKEGVPLRLAFKVSRVEGRACTPVEGAQVDLWQCDALGAYSDVRDFQGLFDTRGQKFLRGYQITDRSGTAEFLTVYPGWYVGRTVHIHFKVRLFSGGRPSREFTSQLYFDEALTDRVHARPPYNSKGARTTRNERDGIFRQGNSGSGLILQLRPDGEGYAGTFSVGLRLS